MGGKQSKNKSFKLEPDDSLYNKYNEDSKKEPDCQQKVDHIKYVFKYIKEASELKLKQKQDKIFELFSDIKNIDLVKILNGKEYGFKLKRLINIKKMVNDIDSWLKNLNWSYDGCPNKATLTSPEDDSNHVYCQIHSYQINESFKPLLFISELEEIRRKAYNLEKIQ